MNARRGLALMIGLALLGCSPGGTRPGPSGEDGGEPPPSEDGGSMVRPDGGTRTDGGRPPPPPTCSGVYPYTPESCDDPTLVSRLMGLDSDSDGLTDHDELCVHGSDPCRVDTNGNGVSDLIMVAAGLDPSSGSFPANDFAVVLPFEGPRENRTLRFGTDIQLADVYFLIDTTGSMGGAITNVRSSLSSIVTRIRERIPDVQMGVGRLDDFPRSSFGSPGDVPYENVQDITPDVEVVRAGLNSLVARGGNDEPESFTEAVYQTATGAGGNWSFTGGPFDLPPRACPTFPDEVAPRRGYPCFRPGALPIVVTVGDANWHNDHTGSYPYSGITPAPATFDQAADALRAIGGRFIGVWVPIGTNGHAAAREMALRTGSVDSSGTPLFYTAPSGSVSDNIVLGIETLVGRTPQDVNTRRENVAGNPDEFDATLFIDRIVPVEGYRDGIPGENPGVSYTSRDESTFYGVIPGTIVEFRVEFYNDVRRSAENAQVFRARIIVVGNGVADLDTRQVYIVVPGEGEVILL